MGIWLDVKSAVRQLRCAPGTGLAAILTLAVGIGTTTAVFSFLAAVMSSASPVDDMERRVAFWSHNRAEAEDKNPVSLGDFLEWRRRATLVDSMVATRRRAVNVGGVDNPVRAGLTEVTPNYFEFFRWTPALGRGFRADDAAAGSAAVVVLSYEFWHNALADRADVVGTTVRLDGEPATIIGVLPRMPAVDGIYVPLVADARSANHATRELFVFARMRAGVSIEQVRAEMEAIGRGLESELPRTNRGWTINTRPLQEEFIGPNARLAFSILAGTVVAVLLIGCVNIANLLLARGLARRGELSVRLALGASHWRVARQLLIECGAVALGGAAMSVLISTWTLQLFVRTFPIDSPWVEGGVNLRVLAFTIAGALIATLLSGVAPILAAQRTNLLAGLHAGGRSGVRPSRRLTRSLVAAEIALAVLLLIVSGLLMRTLGAIQRLDPGFDLTNVLTASVTLPRSMSEAAAARWYEQAVERVRRLPGVVSAAATSRVPFAGSRFNPNRGLEIEGRGATLSDDGTWAVDYVVTPQLIETLRVRMIDGRSFTNADSADRRPVALISAAMARRFWPGGSPLGARLREGDAGQWRTVVGIVADIRNDDADQPPIPYLYVPLAQRPVHGMAIVLRTASDAASMAMPLRRALADFDADQALYDVRTMEEVFASDLSDSRILIQVLAAFAAIALGLAVVGVWSVAAHAVAQRTREVGVRVALGASSRQVVGLLAMDAMVPVFAGLVLGLGAGLVVARVMRSVLFQVSPTDPITIATTILVLATVALVATLGPALRAARLDPLAALRDS